MTEWNTPSMASELLYRAVKNNDTDMYNYVKELNISNVFYIGAARYAIEYNNNAMLERLLEDGADPNGEVRQQSLLKQACDYNSLDSVKILVEHGADINRDGSVLSDAALYGYEEILKYLIENGADVNATYLSKTALECAVQSGQFECVKILIDNGADINDNVIETSEVATSERIRDYLKEKTANNT